MPSGIDLKSLFKDASPAARKYGVVGWPVEHSLSPAMHNAAFRALNLDAVYRAIPVPLDGLVDFVGQAESLPLDGFNVTVPFKEKIAVAIDRARRRLDGDDQDYANTAKREDGCWRISSTDGPGFLDDLAERGVDTAGKRVVLFGAGGSARAVLFALARSPRRPSRITILNRSRDNAEDLLQDLGEAGKGLVSTAFAADAEQAAREGEICVNATSVGLKEGDPLPHPAAAFMQGAAVVYDLVYHRRTAFLQAAPPSARAIGGLGMLVHQGARAFEIWFNRKPPVEIMRKAAEDELNRRKTS